MARIPRIFGLSAALLLCLAGLSGCDGGGGGADGDAGPTDGGYVGETELEVGTADDKGKVFVDLGSGDIKAPILRGPQGGQHIWVMVRFRGDDLSPKKLRIATTMSIKETGVVVKPGTVTMTQTMSEKDGWWQLKTAITSFVKCPCQVYDRKLVIDVDVIDLYGRTAKAQAEVTGTWDGVCSGDVPGSCKAQ